MSISNPKPSPIASSSRHPPVELPEAPSPEVDPSEILSNLSASLATLEESFEPILNHKDGWQGVLNGLGTLERAKLEIMVGYAVNDLVWMFLKSRGIDPSSHEVTAELDRISTYYAKIKAVEDPESRPSSIDKAAAARFIKASIPASQRLPATSAASLARRQAEAAVAEQQQHVGMSTRFKHVYQDVERVVPDNQTEKAEADTPTTEPEADEETLIADADLGEDDDEGKVDAKGISEEETEAFLQSLEDDLARTVEGDVEMARSDSTLSSGPKRKRAEDLM